MTINRLLLCKISAHAPKENINYRTNTHFSTLPFMCPLQTHLPTHTHIRLHTHMPEHKHTPLIKMDREEVASQATRKNANSFLGILI